MPHHQLHLIVLMMPLLAAVSICKSVGMIITDWILVLFLNLVCMFAPEMNTQDMCMPVKLHGSERSVLAEICDEM